MPRLSSKSISTSNPQRRWLFRWLLVSGVLLSSLAIPAYATVYSDAEDGIGDWQVYDNRPVGAEVVTDFDDILDSQVIQTQGNKRNNGYLLGGTNATSGWNNTTEFHLNWRLQATEAYTIDVRVDTTDGWRYLRYTNSNSDALANSTGRSISHGLGSSSLDGIWRVFSRDLVADLAAAQPDNALIAVNGFLVRGSVRLDDIMLADSAVTQTVLPVVSSIVDANAEDGSTSGWRVFDTTPAGASITVVADETTGSQVYELSGTGRSNGYRLGGLDTVDGWNNQSQFSIAWDMQVAESYQIYVRVDTTDGWRYLIYSNSNSDSLLSSNGHNIGFGLGSASKDGQWHSYSRDLAADLALGEPGNTLTAVHGFLVRGSMRVDNIRLFDGQEVEAIPPVAVISGGGRSVTLGEIVVLDGSQSSDDIGIAAFQWNDEAGEPLGSEPQLSLSTSEVGTFSYQLAVTDESGLTATASTQISVQDGSAPTIYEDAEDSAIARWRISDTRPSGASVDNVQDDERNSRVIQLSGTSQQNAFLIGNYDKRAPGWNNSLQTHLRWSMQTDAGFSINVRLETADGFRYLIYDQYTTDRGNSTASNLRFGLGRGAYDGQWQTFTRNVYEDLATFQPGNELIAVHGVQLRGNFRVDDISMLSIVDAAPLAALSVDQSEGSAPLLTSFDASASSDDFGIVNYAFDFDDGSEIVSGTESVVSHTYAVTGEYTAVVTVSDAAGNQASASVVITASPEAVVDNPPMAAFSINAPVTGSTVAFTNESTDDNEVTSVLWNFGDATETGQSSELSPVYSYSSVGEYTVTLTVLDNAGQMDTATQVVGITELDEEIEELVAQVTSDGLTGDAPFTVTLDASGTAGGQGDLTFQWMTEVLDEAGEPTGEAGPSADGVSVSLLLSTFGSYRITLTVLDELENSASTSLTATATEPSGGPGTGVTSGEAARLLAQASFGATSESIARVQELGIEGWIDEQFSLQGSPHLDFVQTHSNGSRQEPRHEIWWRDVVDGEDQLRQRVAFALSQIFVVSDQGYTLGNAQYGITHYYDQLREQAFGNYRDLLETVTLSPVMGVYLSMLQNAKGEVAGNTRADENFAREVLQLFSIGLYELNMDGSVKKSGGQPVHSFSQDQVENYSRVFTGWNFGGATDWTIASINGRANKLVPMQAWPQYHDDDAKWLLGGVVAAAGSGAEADLQLALNSIANHANVGPFISRQLIQRLVTSNPTPAYIERVSRKFNDNGAGVRGDLQAVVRAILLDEEARNGHLLLADYGKLREPVLRLSHLWRAFNISRGSDSVDGIYNTPSPHVKDLDLVAGQAVLKSPSVFNFFHPEYAPLGAIYAQGKVAPEAEIYTDDTILTMTNRIDKQIQYGHDASDSNAKRSSYLNLSAERALAAVSTDALLQHLDVLLLSGNMGEGLRNILVNHLESLPSANTEDGQSRRVRDALSLIMASPDYLVQM